MAGRGRRIHRGALVLGVAAALGAAASAQDPPPITLTTFDRLLINWATAQEREFDFPHAGLPMAQVTMTIELACPAGGCDPWDRGASVYVHGPDASGKMDRFEIARFITPYGRGCSWDVDVTDYRRLLAGRARLGCFIETFIGGEQGWLVTLRFTFTPGAPAREVLSIENLWQGKPAYGDPGNPIEGFFSERTRLVDPATSAAKLRFFVTGHGQGNTDNAAEFARKLHGVQVNADRFEHHLWRDDCDRNPCSPQGGTWQFARAGWCPGDVADPWDVDISGSVMPGEPATIRYQVEPYTNRCRPTAACTSADCGGGPCDYDSGGHTPPIYWVESQWITYRSVLGAGSTHDFQQGAGGYAGVVDTILAEATPAADGSAAAALVVDGDDPSGSRRKSLVLLRFDGIFGDAAGQIAPGTPIGRAALVLSTSDAGSGASVHRMLAPWEASRGWSAYGADGVQAGVEALAEADAIVDARSGGTVEVDVTPSLDAWSADPCRNHGWALLPIGDDGWRFSSAEGGAPPRLIVESRRIAGDEAIAVGDVWRFFKGTQAPPAAWKEPGFVPGAGWLSGPTGIGYDDDDDATVLEDMRGSYASIFCRREFQVGPLPSALRLRIDYDDGFVAFLNGVEVARSPSMGPPGAPVIWSQLASGRDAGALEVYELPISALAEGANVLAIQVHNSALDSSDLSFLPALHADHALLPPGSRWRFLRGSASLPARWKELDFDDAAWEEGPAGIGYGDGDDLTSLLDMEDSYAAVFCRREMLIDAPERLRAATLRLLYDDGIVVFLNGAEVARFNVPAGAVTAQLLASATVEPRVAEVPLPIQRFVPGRNVLAVSVHNASLDSSDLSFDAVVHESPRAAAGDCGQGFRRGDGDGDGAIDITDAILTLGFLFLGGEEPACRDAADADDDGILVITDAVNVLHFLFLEGRSFPPPVGPACGADPTGDELDCREFPACR